jgi:hypothetical protein
MYLRSPFVCLVIILVAAPSWAGQQKPANDAADVIFQNGIHLRVHADDKGPTTVNRYLVVKGPDLIYRLFTDSQGHLLFGYDITAFRSSRQGEIKIQVKPLDQEALSLFHPSDGNAPTEKLQQPTVEKELEMGPVPVGGTVTVSTFTEPHTGRKIADLIQVVASEDARLNEQYPASSSVSSVFDLGDIHVWFNGKEITESRPLRSVSGPYPVLYIPGHGSFFMALGPVPNLPFVQAGSIDGSKLQFMSGSDLILCKSSTPILSAQHQALLWIWHEPNYKLDIPQFDAFLGRPPEDRIQIAVADSIDVWRGLVFSPRGSF